MPADAFHLVFVCGPLRLGDNIFQYDMALVPGCILTVRAKNALDHALIDSIGVRKLRASREPLLPSDRHAPAVSGVTSRRKYAWICVTSADLEGGG